MGTRPDRVLTIAFVRAIPGPVHGAAHTASVDAGAGDRHRSRQPVNRETLRDAVPGWRLLAEYQRQWLAKDVVAGVVLTTLLVPQGMAYAELAGLPAVTGLYTSVAVPDRLRGLRARRGSWCSAPTRRSAR